MSRYPLWLAAAATLAMAGGVSGEATSHVPGPKMPESLLPEWVVSPPAFHSQKTLPVMPQDAPAESSGPSAGSVETLPDPARQVIRQTQRGEYAASTKAGWALLRDQTLAYDDGTWDYVANATARAFIALGNLSEASQVHSAAALRIEDNAVAQFHRLAGQMLKTTKKSAQEVGRPSVFLAELRKHLGPHYEQFKKHIDLAQRPQSLKARLGDLGRAYRQLRIITAADAGLGQDLVRKSYRPAADSLIDDLVPALMKKAQAKQKALSISSHKMMGASEFPVWNRTVRALWNAVTEVKQVCRIHAHLAYLDLATDGRADKPFREAHKLLFVAGKKGQVWQPVGLRRVINGIPQRDMRLCIPWRETVIAPFGVEVAGNVGQSESGLQKMGTDGVRKMEKADLEKMDGSGVKKMDGSGVKKMDGKMDGKMDNGGFRKM